MPWGGCWGFFFGFFLGFPVCLGAGGRCHGFPPWAAREAEPIAGGGGGGGGGDPASAAISLEEQRAGWGGDKAQFISSLFPYF